MNTLQAKSGGAPEMCQGSVGENASHSSEGVKEAGAAIVTLCNTPSGLFPWWDSWVRLLGSRLNDQGIGHYSFYRDYLPTSQFPESSRHQAPSACLESVRWIRENLSPIIARHEQVIIHTHSYYGRIRLWRVTIGNPRVRWFITEHRIGSSPTSALKRSARSVLRQFRVLPHTVVGVSDAAARRAAKLYGSRNIVAIKNGIELNIKRRTWDPRSIPKRGLFVGRVVESKGIVPLVHAMRILRDKGSTATLTIVGDGPDRAGLQRFVDENKLGDTVNLVGYHNNVAPFYATHDFMVIPSRAIEACPLVSLESRCHGLPAIYAPYGGMTETRMGGDNGIALSTNDESGIATAIMSLQSDVDRFCKLVDGCFEGLEYFAIDRMIDEYVQLYRSSLGMTNGTHL